MKVRTAVALATLAPLAALGFVVVPQFAGERWDEMVAWADRTQQEWARRDFTRPPAWGAATPGEASKAYDDALAQAAVLLHDDEQLLCALRLQPETVDAAAADAFAQRWSACLQTLVAGAHRDDARPRVLWQSGFSTEATDMNAARQLINALTIEVRRRLAAGDGLAAVRLCLDGATFAVDLERCPMLVDQVIAAVLLSKVAGDTLRDRELQQLGAPALAELDAGLARLDGCCALHFDGLGETLLLARTLIGQTMPGNGAGTGSDGAPGLRYGWSRRWAEADAVMSLVDACEQLTGCRSLPWPQRRARIEQTAAAMVAAPNTILRAVAPQWTGIERQLRCAAVQLRLLRLAVAWHRGGELPALDDPLGSGPIEVVRGAVGATFRSQGGSAEHPLQRTVAH